MENRTKVIKNDLFFAEVERMLRENKQVKIPVKGKSMRPFLKDGDVVVLKLYDLHEVSIGDIVLGKYQGKYMLHRVQQITKSGIRMMGDGNLQQIEDVPHAEVVATAIAAYRGDRSLAIKGKLSLFLAKIWYKIPFLRRIFSIFKRF